MKQTKLWMTTIAVLMCSLTASAHNFSVGGIYYNISSSTNLTVEVTYRGNDYDSYSNVYTGAVTIPTTVTYNNETYTVTSIGDWAFYDCRSLTAITIPEGVTSIGGRAFEYCSSLTSITLPESVTSIGGRAFYNCSNLTSITVDEDNSVYDSRNSCNAIIETSSNTLIQGCSATIIPEGVTSIGNSAFYGCSSLTSITIPESVTSIGGSAFSDCSSLTSITVDEDNSVYDSRNSCNAIIETSSNTLIQGCSATIIPEGVTSIGDNAFYLSSLTAINIPEGVTSIGDYAFCQSSLTSITISKSVTSIGKYAFYLCHSLYRVFNNSNLSLSKGSSSYGYVASYARVVYNKRELTTVGDFQFHTSNGVHSLDNYIGNDTEIVLPDSYNSESYNIGDYVFVGCSSLTSVTIPEGVTSIGYAAFAGCI